MPLGVESPALGMVGFGVVKLAGYTTFVRYMQKSNPSAGDGFVKAGLVRTLIGVGFGIAYGAVMTFPLMIVGATSEGLAAMVFYAGLFPVRLIVWDIILRVFFKPLRASEQAWRWRLLGTGCSYLLDIPAILGVFTLGGMWVC